jgi:Phage tail assembly chaperone protein, TAC
MVEFEIGGNNYRAGKLDAFKQLHVSRKLAGVLPKVLPALIAATTEADGGDMVSLLSACEPAAEALAAMPEADVDFVFHTCLGVVQRQQGSAWSAIWNPQGKVLQFSDIDLPQMTEIVFKVLQDSLGPTMAGLIARAPAAKAPAA